MFLTDGEDKGLADFPADGIAQGIFEEGLAEKLIRGTGEEALFKLPLLIGLFLLFAFLVCKGYDETLFGEQFGGDLGASG